MRISKYIGTLIRETPLIESVTINNLLNDLIGRRVEVFFKCEHLQSVGSFKIRGALNFALKLSDEQRVRGIITHSSGNHGIAVAAAASALGIKAVIVVPRGAPEAKLEIIRKYGAELTYSESTLESRQSVCQSQADRFGMTIVPPFDHEWTMEGQGTIAVDISSQLPSVDALVVAVGGCGMISGISIWAKHAYPGVKIYGIEPEAVDDTAQSLIHGRRTGPSDATASTICDALRVNPPGELCFPIVQKNVEKVLTVSDSEVVDAMRILWNDLGQKTEPSGACATAGLFSEVFLKILREDHSIKRICVVICGANIEDTKFHEYLRPSNA